MTLIEKIKAMGAAFEIAIRLDINERWYASGPEIGGDGMLRGIAGRGDTPEAAVDDLWNQVTAIPSDRHVHLRSGRRVRWNGFMWEDVRRTA